ncbi:CPBP family intramembrane metalloprotease [Lysinibacillus composti]|uniref:CPBP family intramembrane metalloprotease n=2 Tax=Lysinibacillus composti TaxID=720633 RepID=A0A3N9URV3_9BACI|nr:CPBP family intramembrane metalloprotease [Lysinibacillus composti]
MGKMKRNDLKISILLAVICFIGGFLVLPYQLDAMQQTLPHQYEQLIETMPVPMILLQLITAIQLTVMAFIVAFLGIKIARKVGFSLDILDALFTKTKVSFETRWVVRAFIFGAISAFVIVGADRFYYQNKISGISDIEPEFSLIGLIAGVFYGGVFEELLMRLFVMSLLIWLVKILFYRGKSELPSLFYWMAIIIAALLFAIGHLPATDAIFGGVTTDLMIRSLILNGIAGIFCGYLFWKKGIEYAILSHMFAHISLQLIMIPLFY